MARRLRQTGVLVLVATALIVMARPAQAARPTVEKVSIDQTSREDFLSDTCGFSVMRHVVRNLTIFTHDDGTQLFVLTGQNYDVFSGAGGSLMAQQTGMDRYTLNPDGTITDVAAGNYGIATVPGKGLVSGGAGKVVTVYDPQSGDISYTLSGNFRPEDFGAFCGALAGKI